MADPAQLRAAVCRAILDGRGRTTAAERRRAFDGDGDGVGGGPAVASYLAKVRDHAYRVTDDDVAGLRAAGLDDDRIFELSVATAVGQATRQYDAALAALDAALAAGAAGARSGGR